MTLSDWLELSIDVSLHCICMITFLTCFYFFYVYPIENKIISDTMRNITKQAIHLIINSPQFSLVYKDLNEKQFIMNLMSHIDMERLRKEAIQSEADIQRFKKDIMTNTFIIIAVISFVIFMIHYMIIIANKKWIQINFQKILYSIMYSMSFIIIIEVVFFIFVSKRLQPTSIEQLDYIIIETITNSIKSIRS